MFTTLSLTFADKNPGFIEDVVSVAEKYPSLQVVALEYELVTEVHVTSDSDSLDLSQVLSAADEIARVAAGDHLLFLVALTAADEDDSEVENG